MGPYLADVLFRVIPGILERQKSDGFHAVLNDPVIKYVKWIFFSFLFFLLP